MDIYEQNVIKKVAEKSGEELESITRESFLEDDLNLGEMEIEEMLEEIEEAYSIDISEEKDDVSTVGEIVDLVIEKVE